MNQVLSLNELGLGNYGIVVKINGKDKIKRRFLDLGIIPDTKIKVLYESPFKDPRAYFIRGAVIALRKEDADLIEIRRMEENEWD